MASGKVTRHRMELEKMDPMLETTHALFRAEDESVVSIPTDAYQALGEPQNIVVIVEVS